MQSFYFYRISFPHSPESTKMNEKGEDNQRILPVRIRLRFSFKSLAGCVVTHFSFPISILIFCMIYLVGAVFCSWPSMIIIVGIDDTLTKLTKSRCHQMKPGKNKIDFLVCLGTSLCSGYWIKYDHTFQWWAKWQSERKNWRKSNDETVVVVHEL